MHVLWDIFCALPLWVRVAICVSAWFAFAELVALFCAMGTRFDREVDSAREAQREALTKPLPRDRRRLGTVR